MHEEVEVELIPAYAKELAILEFLAETGEATLSAIAKKLGMDKTSTKRNLVRLHDYGLVDKRYEAGRVYYRLTRNGYEELIKLRESVKKQLARA